MIADQATESVDEASAFSEVQIMFVPKQTKNGAAEASEVIRGAGQGAYLSVSVISTYAAELVLSFKESSGLL